MKKAMLGILASGCVFMASVQAHAQGAPDALSLQSLDRCGLPRDAIDMIHQNQEWITAGEKFSLDVSNGNSWKGSDGKGGNWGGTLAHMRQRIALKAYCSSVIKLVPKLRQRLGQN